MRDDFWNIGADGAPAVWGPNAEVSRASLVGMTTRAAAYLMDHQVERLMIVSGQTTEAYAIIWACFLSGVSFTSVDHQQPAARVHTFIQQLRPGIVLGSQDGFTPFSELLGYHRQLDVAESPLVDPDSVAYILFTSGSTGEPKGVCVRRGAVENVVRHAITSSGVERSSRWAQYSSLGFDLGVLDTLVAFASGCCLVPFDGPGAKLRPASRLMEAHITHWHSVPTVIDLWKTSSQLDQEHLSSLQVALFCGEPLYRKQIEDLFEVNPDLVVFNNYGPTEATIYVTSQRVTRDSIGFLAMDTMPIGDPIPGTVLGFEPRDSGLDELLISGLSVAQGYLHQSFPSRDYLTGDYVRRVNGRVYFVERRDSQVKIRGNRVDTSEVDAAIRNEGASASSTVFAGGRLVSFVVGLGLSPEGLLRRLHATLPSYYIPARVKLIDRMPTTSGGKVDKRQLEEMARVDAT